MTTLHVSFELTWGESDLVLGSTVRLQVTFEALLEIREATAIFAADTHANLVSIVCISIPFHEELNECITSRERYALCLRCHKRHLFIQQSQERDFFVAPACQPANRELQWVEDLVAPLADVHDMSPIVPVDVADDVGVAVLVVAFSNLVGVAVAKAQPKTLGSLGTDSHWFALIAIQDLPDLVAVSLYSLSRLILIICRVGLIFATRWQWCVCEVSLIGGTIISASVAFVYTA